MERLTVYMDKASRTVSPFKFFLLTYILSWSTWITLILTSSQITEGLSNIVRLLVY
jgi:hypothetical protein